MHIPTGDRLASSTLLPQPVPAIDKKIQIFYYLCINNLTLKYPQKPAKRPKNTLQISMKVYFHMKGGRNRN